MHIADMRCCLPVPLGALAGIPGPGEVLRSGLLLAPALLRSALPTARPRHPRSLAAVHLELVTLTEDRAVITWHTAQPGTDDGTGRMLPAVTEGEVRYGTHPARLNRTAGEDRPTAHHHIELTGLEPGQTYYYQAHSRGVPATPTALHLVRGNAAGTSRHGLGSPGGPYSFTTPQPPPGRHLLSLGLCNDLHIGETVAGLVAGVPFLRGVAQRAGLAPYPELMSGALVDEARRRGAQLLLAAGDISAGGGPRDLAEARRILDGFGTHARDYFVVRGNHDRRARDGDAFHRVFGGQDRPGWFEHDVAGLRIIGLDTYDKRGNGGDAGGLGSEQLSWFRSRLRAHREQPTVVFGHHPLTVRDALFPVSPGQRLGRRQARAILRAYAAAPGVFLHHVGHTHRNKRTHVPLAPQVTLQEVGAAKEYPGGFFLLRIHSGGYALNFFRARAAEALEWNERSRRQAGGLWPHHALGRTVADRNSVTARDLSGIGRLGPPSAMPRSPQGMTGTPNPPPDVARGTAPP
ncbi:metallophosphoesterase family protein [Streptomyces sasae]|uniref:metallophosphoesterase family protein n=1 Tax=Streptomyces sasae TaxID=1266772 RepID=UPI002931C60A|nr:metallophosphoesterase family protein [Streptomyces sasae]